MNFDFSDDQKLLKEQVRKFLADKCPTKVVRRVLDGNESFADEVWKGLVELGIPATGIPEAYGGLGLSPLELCVIAEEIGRAAAPVPFDSSVVLATEAIKLLLGKGDVLAGRLLTYDSLAMRFRELKLRRDPKCALCGPSPTLTGYIDYEGFCSVGA
mgnify:CR=1 FL=1